MQIDFGGSIILEGQMVKGFIDGILLSILSERESYGYDMMKTVQERTDRQLEIKEGTLYPALRRLEAEGLIVGKWATHEQGARRRYYHITQNGKDELQRIKASWSKNYHVIHTFLKEDYSL